MSYDWQCGGHEAGSNVPAEQVISGSKIVDLTAKMDAGGILRWDAPALPGVLLGEWTVIRFGGTGTCALVHPSPISGTGPECGKLSKAAIETYDSGRN